MFWYFCKLVHSKIGIRANEKVSRDQLLNVKRGPRSIIFKIGSFSPHLSIFVLTINCYTKTKHLAWTKHPRGVRLIMLYTNLFYTAFHVKIIKISNAKINTTKFDGAEVSTRCFVFICTEFFFLCASIFSFQFPSRLHNSFDLNNAMAILAEKERGR